MVLKAAALAWTVPEASGNKLLRHHPAWPPCNAKQQRQEVESHRAAPGFKVCCADQLPLGGGGQGPIRPGSRRARISSTSFVGQQTVSSCFTLKLPSEPTLQGCARDRRGGTQCDWAYFATSQCDKTTRGRAGRGCGRESRASKISGKSTEKPNSRN